MSLRILSIVISFFTILILYWFVDVEKIANVFFHIKPVWLLMGFLLIAPTILLSALRLNILASHIKKIDFLESVKLILAASVMNLVLPSKMGDIAKSIFIVKDKKLTYAQALPLVIFEKLSDFLALLFICIVGIFFIQKTEIFYFYLLISLLVIFFTGLLMIGSKSFSNFSFKLILLILPKNMHFSAGQFLDSWQNICSVIIKKTANIFVIFLLSMLLWFFHLLQIWLFILSLSSTVSFLESLAFTPLAIFAGLLPISFSGIGARDFAFIFLYSGHFSSATGAALGILATFRYIIPAIIGIPFFSQYVYKSKKN